MAALAAAGLALLLAACDQPMAAALAPHPASPPPPARTDEQVARETLRLLIEREPGAASLFPREMAMKARVAALIALPAGAVERQSLDDALARLRSLSSALGGSGR